MLSPTLFNIFLEGIMTDALEQHEGVVNIGGRTITNLRFADGIDRLAREEQELADLVESLDKKSTSYCIETSAEKTKLMTNNRNGIATDIRARREKLKLSTSSNTLAQSYQMKDQSQKSCKG